MFNLLEILDPRFSAEGDRLVRPAVGIDESVCLNLRLALPVHHVRAHKLCPATQYSSAGKVAERRFSK